MRGGSFRMRLGDCRAAPYRCRSFMILRYREYGGLILLTLLFSCASTDVSTEHAPLVVRALLAAGRDSQFVDVGRAAVLQQNFVPPMVPESGASVVLNGPADRWILSELSPGRYACACHVNSGARYTVEVQTEVGEEASGVTHVPLSPQVSPADTSLSSPNTITRLSWASVTNPGQYGVYFRKPPSANRAFFLQYTPDTTFLDQPLAGCNVECCEGSVTLIVAFSPSILTERGFPMPPGLSDTLDGAIGIVGSATADSAIFHLANAGSC